MAKAESPAWVPIGSMLPKTPEEKKRALDLAISCLQKETKDPNIVMSLGSRVGKPYPHLATGIAELDLYALGIGGFPDGRIIELYGPESGGKTTLLLQLIAAAQQAGGMAAFIDAEHALDPNYAKKLNVDVDALHVSQPDYGEQALEVAIALVESGALRVVGVDSVAALVPLTELQGEMTDAHVGLQARMMSKAMRKLEGVASKTGTTVVFINQIREKIGVMFGNPETTSGGRALKFAASVRVDVRRIAGATKDGDTPTGHMTKLKVVKNKMAPPFRECEVRMRYDEVLGRYGFDGQSSLITLATKLGVVDKSGAWYSFRTERIGQGLDKASDFLYDNGGMALEIRKAVEEKIAVPAA